MTDLVMIKGRMAARFMSSSYFPSPTFSTVLVTV